MTLQVTHFRFGHPVSCWCLIAYLFVSASVSKSNCNKNAASVTQIQVSLAASALQLCEVIDVTNTGHIKAKYFFSLPPLIGTKDFTWLLLLFPPLPSPPRRVELDSEDG